MEPEPRYDQVVPTQVRGFQRYHLPLVLYVIVLVVVIPGEILLSRPGPINLLALAVAIGPITVVFALGYFLSRVNYPRQIAVGADGITIWNFGRPVTVEWRFLQTPSGRQGDWVSFPTLPETPGYRGIPIRLTEAQARAVVAAPYHPNWPSPSVDQGP